MAINTDYRRWNISSGFSAAAGAGVFSGTIANYTLKGSSSDARESFDFTFGGIGVGGAVGVELHLGEHLVSAGNAVASTQSGRIETSVATGILFAGDSRSAADFDGIGTIFDFSAGLGLVGGLQVILFGFAPNHSLLARWGRIAYEVASGLRQPAQLVRDVPAITLVASCLSLGAGASATCFTGYFQGPGHRSQQTAAPVSRPSYNSYGSPRFY